MFRILIVEDVEDTLHQLVTFISECFSDIGEGTISEIHGALSATQGRKFIEEAFGQKQPYDAVILDLNLPDQIGLPARVDESVCSMIVTLMPSTLIAHITAYQDDDVVREHLQKAHFENVASDCVVFSKVDYEYPIHLVEHLKTTFLGRRLEEHMNKIWGDCSPAFLATSRRRGVGDERSRAHELAALRRDIEANWAYLDERVQRRIRDTFKVDTTGGRVTINLLREI